MIPALVQRWLQRNVQNDEATQKHTISQKEESKSSKCGVYADYKPPGMPGNNPQYDGNRGGTHPGSRPSDGNENLRLRIGVAGRQMHIRLIVVVLSICTAAFILYSNVNIN